MLDGPQSASRGGTGHRWTILSASLAIGLGCGEPGSISFAQETDRFPVAAPAEQPAFDLVVADMDLDGDPDLLVNQHHVAPLELFENREGRFVLLDPDGNGVSGLRESAGAPDLFASAAPLIADIEASGSSGVHVWHDLDRRGAWNFFVVPDGKVLLRIRTNSPIESVSLDPARYTRTGAFALDAEISEQTHFRVKPRLVATRLEVRTSSPLYAGARRRRVDGDPWVVWKEDPHGIAWVDASGTKQPDLYVTRGGLQGSLRPPREPKTDRFFEYRGEPTLFVLRPEAIPPDYGRGRQVAWLDVDGDGSNELYIGNTKSRNVLLAEDGSGTYRDIAPERGVDLFEEDAFAWIDLDDDGLDELVALGPRGFRVGWNRRGDRFSVVPGTEIGLVLPRGSASPGRRLFDTHSLHVVDFDNDGLLDIWLTGHGEGLRQARYHFDGKRFTVIESKLEVAARAFVLLDVDNDAFIDAVALGAEHRLLHNLGARGGFRARPFAEGWQIAPQARAVAADVDGDGRTDLVVAGRRRLVARNSSSNGNSRLRVRLAARRPPIGAVVRAHYSNGMVRAQRYGSVEKTRYSQGLEPLSFGVPAGVRLERLEVRWPGGQESSVAVEGASGIAELRRPESGR